MKKLVFSFVFLISLCSYSEAGIFELPFDFNTAVWQGAMLSETMNGVIQTKDLIVKTQQALQMAAQTKMAIENLYEYQKQIQKDIMSVMSIKDMKWADVIDITSRALGMSTNPKDYLPNIDLKHAFPIVNFLNTYNIEPDPKRRADVSGLWRVFGPTIEDWVIMHEKKEAAYQQFLYEHFDDHQLRSMRMPFMQKIDTFLMNRLLIQETKRRKLMKEYEFYLAKSKDFMDAATEMNIQILKEGFFNMTQGERASALKECRDMIYESSEAKSKALECLEKASIKTEEEDLFFRSQVMDDEFFKMECMIKFGEFKKVKSRTLNLSVDEE